MPVSTCIESLYFLLVDMPYEKRMEFIRMKLRSWNERASPTNIKNVDIIPIVRCTGFDQLQDMLCEVLDKAIHLLYINGITLIARVEKD